MQILLKKIDVIIILNLLIFTIGFLGVFFNKKNLLLLLISIEIIFLGLNLNFVLISIYLDDLVGHIFILFILSIVACESAIALSFFILLYKFKETIVINKIKENAIIKL